MGRILGCMLKQRFWHPTIRLLIEVAFTFAHYPGGYFRYLGFRDGTLEPDDVRRRPRGRSNEPESIIAVNASVSRL
jgi:hypothetical protein